MLARLAAAALLLAPAAASAQLGRTHPAQSYFFAIDELYDGEYRDAERRFRAELRTAVRTVDTRWIDSILYASMLGESLYQQGRLAEALAAYDTAVDLFLANSRWMSRVRFQQPPREAPNIGRQTPAWARVRATYGDVPTTFLYRYGEVDNSAAAQQGGVVRQAQFWRLNAEELARTVAWTLYRRGELLGPLGASDPRARAVRTTLAGGAGQPGGHWTDAWVALWRGLATASAGDLVEARPLLERSTLLGSRLTHRLSGLAWLALGRIAAADGDVARTEQAYRLAVSTAIALDDPGVLTEATRAWHEASAVEVKFTPPPLGPIGDWALRQGWDHVAIDCRLAAAEAALLAGDASAAADFSRLFRRDREAAAGLLGREAQRLVAMSATRLQPLDQARVLAADAVRSQTTMSRRGLQLALAVNWSNDGTLAQQETLRVISQLLDDPTASAWAAAPLDVIAALTAPHTAVHDRLFAVAAERRDAILAARVIDSQRRHELLAAAPLGGRPTAVRWLLEAPVERLPEGATQLRASFEGALPGYRDARRDGAAAEAELVALLDTEEPDGKAIRRVASRLRDSLETRERLVLWASLSRLPTPLVFPPAFDPVAAKTRLEPGEAVLAWHTTGDEVWGVIATGDGEHLWRAGPSKRIAIASERLLRSAAGEGPRQVWTAETLDDTAWRDHARDLSELLLAGSRLDASSLERVRVVPDGPLWRTPLALLPIEPSAIEPEPGADAEQPQRLGDAAMTYAPTLGWATRSRASTDAAKTRRPAWRFGVDSAIDTLLGERDPVLAVARARTGVEPVATSVTLAKALAGCAVFDVGARLGGDPSSLELLRGPRGDREVAVWRRLPIASGPAVALTGIAGGEAGRPRESASIVGAPEMHLIGGLLAGGAESMLVERWATGGANGRALVAEWANGLTRLDPNAAWQRSRSLAASSPLDPSRETRLGFSPDGPPKPTHPFWWSGYLLID